MPVIRSYWQRTPASSAQSEGRSQRPLLPLLSATMSFATWIAQNWKIWSTRPPSFYRTGKVARMRWRRCAGFRRRRNSLKGASQSYHSLLRNMERPATSCGASTPTWQLQRKCTVADADRVHVEHIYPQNPVEGNRWQEHDRQVRRIGNLSAPPRQTAE